MATNSGSFKENINNWRLWIWKKNQDLYDPKYQFLANKGEIAGLKHLNDSKAFVEYSNHMDDIYKNIQEYIPKKKLKISIVFEDMISDTLSSKKFNSAVT